MNKKRILSLVLLLAGTLYVYSQKGAEKAGNRNQSIVRINLMPPGIILEQQVLNSLTVYTGIKFGISTSDFEINPIFVLEPRYYTTLEKRKRKGKRTDYFSSGYIGLQFHKTLDNSNFSIGPVYGFQNLIGRKFFWNISIGYGYVQLNDEDSTGVIGDLGIGLILN